MGAVSDPAPSISLNVHSGGHAVCGSISGIEFNRLVEVLQSLVIAFIRPLMKACHAVQELIIGIETLSGLPLSPFNLSLFKLWSDCSDHSCGHLILQSKNVFDSAVEPIGPEVGACRRIN